MQNIYRLFSIISIAILLGVGMPAKTVAQDLYYEFDSLSQQAYTQILCLQLDSARHTLQTEEAQQPHNLMPVLLYNYIDVLQIVLTEDKQTFEQWKSRKKERLHKWKEGPENSPWHISGEAHIKLQWAFARVLFNEYFTAAREINSAYHLLEDNAKDFPSFMVDNMGIGVLHAMIGVIPDQYQWALQLFGFYGTIDQGLAEVLQQVNARAPAKNLSVEALFYYTFLKTNLHSAKDRNQIVISLFNQPFYRQMRQKSPLINFAYCNTLFYYDNDSAIIALQATKQKEDALYFHYLDLLLGQALVYKNDTAAVGYLTHYIKHYPGINYKKIALQRLAWYHFMQKDTVAYRQYMADIAQMPDAILDGDQSAEKESAMAAKGYVPNLYLLRGRLFFDGHYYQKALQALEPIANNTADEATLLEYHYRKGRILQEMGNKEEALSSYALAIKYGQNSKRYFSGRAALESGIIHEQQSNNAQAAQAYKTCLSLPFSEYRRGIRAKAKAGLQRVEGAL